MKRVISSFIVISLVGACATPYRPIPFDRTTSKIDNIQVVEDTMPPEPVIRKLATNGQNISSAASGFGLAGLAVTLVAAGVEASIAAGQKEKINKALASQNFDGEKIFDEAFEAALKAQNYNISTISTPRDINRAFVVTTAQPNAPEGSAVLDVNSAGYGYQQVGGLQWRPFVVISVKMTDAKDPTKVLLDNKVEYNAVAPVPLTVSVPGDEQYGFAKPEDIEANPERAAEGLKKAIVEAANATAQLLK